MALLTPEQRAFLDMRLADHLNVQPEFATLAERHLSIGGVHVVAPRAPEPDLAILLARGQIWDGKSKLVRGYPSQCHTNAAHLYLRNTTRFHIVTGYALSDDGLWRQHSWIYDTAPLKRKRTIETTERRERYYGVALDETEAATFADINA
ncbi:MAG: hypothetical protein ACXWQR_20420 [Ktedonobacterales bacterium]